MSPYVVYSSASRRRRLRRRKNLLRLALAAVALLAFLLVWTGTGEHQPVVRTGPAGAASGQIDSGPLGREDGYVAVGASLSPFSEDPAVASLDADLRDAVRQAANGALADGIELRVNGGWRSARYQRELLDRAVQTYGSVEAARQ